MTEQEDWKPYFAVLPVMVDAYDESERRNGKFRYLKFGWVRRCYVPEHEHDDGDGDGSHIVAGYWKYRL